jgi:hypothetical protein
MLKKKNNSKRVLLSTLDLTAPFLLPGQLTGHRHCYCQRHTHTGHRRTLWAPLGNTALNSHGVKAELLAAYWLPPICQQVHHPLASARRQTFWAGEMGGIGCIEAPPGPFQILLSCQSSALGRGLLGDQAFSLDVLFSPEGNEEDIHVKFTKVK